MRHRPPAMAGRGGRAQDERSSSRSNRLSAIARAASNRRYDMTGETGSYRYMAPEVFRHEPYNSKVDVRRTPSTLPSPSPSSGAWLLGPCFDMLLFGPS